MSEIRNMPRGNSLYVRALEELVKGGMGLDEAYQSFLNEAKAGPGGGEEHLSEIRQAYEHLKGQDAKS